MLCVLVGGYIVKCWNKKSMNNLLYEYEKGERKLFGKLNLY